MSESVLSVFGGIGLLDSAFEDCATCESARTARATHGRFRTGEVQPGQTCAIDLTEKSIVQV